MNTLYYISLSMLLAGPIDMVPENDQSGLFVDVAVDRDNRVYYEGEAMTIRFTAEKPCYVYVINKSPSGKALIIYPNKYQKDNRVGHAGGAAIEIPARDSRVKFRARPPFGKEAMIIVGSTKKLAQFEVLKPRERIVTEIDNSAAKDIRAELDVPANKPDWAEARIAITTMKKDDGKQREPQRFAVCVGISEFQDDRIRNLTISHLDAGHFAQAMKTCNVPADNIVLLQNEQATRAAIERAIFEQLPKKTVPGDTIFLFFSCHGGRCADTNDDEPDGVDEYLVPYDAVLNEPKTMILDDTFANWMQSLSGRHVLITMDNCYAGGTSKGIGGPRPKGLLPADSFNGEFSRLATLSKELTQDKTVVIAASKPDERAWEMTSGGKSVLTHFFLEALASDKTDSNMDGRIVAAEVFQAIEKPIQAYVKDQFKVSQTPLMFNNSKGDIVLRRLR